MIKKAILVTGTPCVGKTSVALRLSRKLDAQYVNLTELAINQSFVLEKDERRDTLIVDDKKMKQKIAQIIKEPTKKQVVIDGHYAAKVTPTSLVSHVFVLRRNPVELRELMEKRGYSKMKLWENLAAEILDVSLVDALSMYDEERICELDVSGKHPEDIVNCILAILDGHVKCSLGVVDWLGKLEAEGLLVEYLRI